MTADLDRAYYSHGYRMSCSPLTEAVRYNIPLAELLIEARADPYKKHETCALYHGIQLASVDMCMDLFKHGCGPNTWVDSDLAHYKAIHFAAYFGASCLVHLVDEDADIVRYHDILLDQLFKNIDAKILKYCLQNVYSWLADNVHCWYKEFVDKEMRGCATTLGCFTGEVSQHKQPLLPPMKLLNKNIQTMNLLAAFSPMCLQK